MKKYLISSIIAGLIVAGCDNGASNVGSVPPAGDSHKLLHYDDMKSLLLLPILPPQEINSYTHNEVTRGIIINKNPDPTGTKTPRTIFKIRVTCDGSISNRDDDYKNWKTAQIDGVDPTPPTENDTTLNLSDPSFKVSSKTICYPGDTCNTTPSPSPSLRSYYIKVDNSTITGGSYCSIQIDQIRYHITNSTNNDSDLLSYCYNNKHHEYGFVQIVKDIIEKEQINIPASQINSCEDAVGFIGSITGASSISNYYLNWQVNYLNYTMLQPSSPSK